MGNLNDDYTVISYQANLGALGQNDLPVPTKEQLLSGKYAKGGFIYHGLKILIENPCHSYRKGIDQNGKAWACQMQAHYGYIANTLGKDGDELDVFFGVYPESDTVFIINQQDKDGNFDEHKIMLGFLNEANAKMTYQLSYDRGWNGLSSIIKANLSQFLWWLKYGNHKKTLQSNHLPLEGLESLKMAKFNWNNQDSDILGTTLAQVLYDLRQGGDGDLLNCPVTMHDIGEHIRIDLGGQLTAMDALLSKVRDIDRRMERLLSIMNLASTTDIKVIAKTISDPFKRNGTTNIAVLFELSDGQTVTVWFHNPDSTPNKLAPDDTLISWRWQINKKDVTLLVAPESGKDLDMRRIAKRIMAFIAKNSASFARANTKRTERLAAIGELEKTVTAKNSQLDAVNNELAATDALLNDAEVRLAELKAENAKNTTPPNKTERVNEGLAALNKIRPFLSGSQFKVLAQNIKSSEESEYFIDKVLSVQSVIDTMPKTYEQDGKGNNAVAYLHYFGGSSDFYITEKDKTGNGTKQAFGLADIFGDGGELGYISISDIVSNGMELDLYWTPKTLAVINGAEPDKDENQEGNNNAVDKRQTEEGRAEIQNAVFAILAKKYNWFVTGDTIQKSFSGLAPKTVNSDGSRNIKAMFDTVLFDMPLGVIDVTDPSGAALVPETTVSIGYYGFDNAAYETMAEAFNKKVDDYVTIRRQKLKNKDFAVADTVFSALSKDGWVKDGNNFKKTFANNATVLAKINNDRFIAVISPKSNDGLVIPETELDLSDYGYEDASLSKAASDFNLLVADYVEANLAEFKTNDGGQKTKFSDLLSLLIADSWVSSGITPTAKGDILATKPFSTTRKDKQISATFSLRYEPIGDYLQGYVNEFADKNNQASSIKASIMLVDNAEAMVKAISTNLELFAIRLAMDGKLDTTNNQQPKTAIYGIGKSKKNYVKVTKDNTGYSLSLVRDGGMYPTTGTLQGVQDWLARMMFVGGGTIQMVKKNIKLKEGEDLLELSSVPDKAVDADLEAAKQLAPDTKSKGTLSVGDSYVAKDADGVITKYTIQAIKDNGVEVSTMARFDTNEKEWIPDNLKITKSLSAIDIAGIENKNGFKFDAYKEQSERDKDIDFLKDVINAQVNLTDAGVGSRVDSLFDKYPDETDKEMQDLLDKAIDSITDATKQRASLANKG